MTVMTTERPAAVAPTVYTAPPQRAGALSLSHLSAADAWRFCQSLAQSALLPREYRDNPGSVLWAMEYGRALGLDVVTTITTIHVINGKPTQSADLMLSRAREAGHRVRVQVGDGQCTVSIWRHDDAEFENRVTWTYADAERARLLPGKPDSNWQKYPRAMLRARAVAECVRSACPEVLHGAIYTPEELGAVVDQDGIPVPEAGFVRQQPQAADQWAQAAPAAAPAPVAEQPQEDYAAAEGDISGGRDYLSEAVEAPTADAVRALWREAKAAGWSEDRLAEIVSVGRARADQFARRQAQDPTPTTAESGTQAAGATDRATASADPEPEALPGAPDDQGDRLDAIAALYAAGEAAGLSQVETRQVLVQQTGRGLADATADEIAAVAADLRAAGGAR